jgi:cation:H+ antiporter
MDTVTIQFIYFLFSIWALYWGAELALEAAEKIGLYLGMSPLVIGLVLIGFGTSLPEMFVSHLAVGQGDSSIAIGNIIGSNVANIFLIMGVSSLLAPLFILRKEILVQLFIHLGLTSLLAVIAFFWGFNRASSITLLIFFISYLAFTFYDMIKSRKLRQIEEEDVEEVTKIGVMVVLKLLGGFALLYIGGELIVSSGSAIGKHFGISTYVISAIFMALGTSFPELITAILACYRKKNTDLITGNIIGSNIFNVALVLGSIGIYAPLDQVNVHTEVYLLLAVSLLFLILYAVKQNLGKASGITFLAAYGYAVYHWIS